MGNDVRLLFPRLMAAVIELVANLYSLFMLVFMFGLKIMFMVIHTWVELVKATIIAHLNMFRRTMIWIITLILLPIRVLTALQRERLVSLLKGFLDFSI